MPTIKLENVRIAFVESLVGDAQEYQGNGNFRHSATFLIEPGSANDKAILAAIKTAATEIWPKKVEAMLDNLRPQQNKYCYQSGDLKEYDGFEGMMFIAGHRKQADGRPLLLDSVGGADGKPARLMGSDGKFHKGKEGRIYAGCYVNVKIDIYAQDGTNAGIRCGLKTVQFHHDGDSFSGAGTPSDDGFETIEAPETEDALD